MYLKCDIEKIINLIIKKQKLLTINNINLPLLNNQWILYYYDDNEINWKNKIKSIFTIGDIITFWVLYNNIYEPSKYVLNYEKASLYFFKNKIFPDYDDPIHKYGGNISIGLSYIIEKYNYEIIDTLWKNCILLLISSKYDIIDYIFYGCIFNVKKNNKSYIEFWIKDINIYNKNKEYILKILNDELKRNTIIKFINPKLFSHN